MLNLIKADFYRIFKDKVFWIMIIICFSFALLFPVFEFGLASFADGTDPYNPFGVSFTAVTSMSLNAFIVPIFLLILLSKDVMNGTIRNKVIVGKTRIEIFMSNLVISIIMVLAITIATALIGLISSFIFFHNGITAEAFSNYIIRLLLVLVGWLMVAISIASFATIMKNVGLSIVCYMVFYYIFILVGIFLMTFIPFFIQDGNQLAVDVAIGVLNANPFYSMMMTIPPSGGLGISAASELLGGPIVDEVFYAEYLSSIVIYMVLFFCLGYFVFKNKDLK